jgi:hypothetical protein
MDFLYLLGKFSIVKNLIRLKLIELKLIGNELKLIAFKKKIYLDAVIGEFL